MTHAEESGIDRRLLMLTMNKKIADHMPDDEEFAAKLVAREGPAIMTWLMQGAMEGWKSLERTNTLLGDLADPFKQTAAEYRREANPFLQWITDEMRLDPAQDSPAPDAFRAFTTYMRDQNPRFHISKPDFRDGLERVTEGRVRYKMRSKIPNKGTMLDGLTYANGEGLTHAGGNVISFPKP